MYRRFSKKDVMEMTKRIADGGEQKKKVGWYPQRKVEKSQTQWKKYLIDFKRGLAENEV